MRIHTYKYTFTHLRIQTHQPVSGNCSWELSDTTLVISDRNKTVLRVELPTCLRTTGLMYEIYAAFLNLFFQDHCEKHITPAEQTVKNLGTYRASFDKQKGNTRSAVA